MFFFGRPVRVGQFRGSPLLDWEENLPKVPDEVAAENARFVAERLVAERLVAERLVAAYGGRAHIADGEGPSDR